MTSLPTQPSTPPALTTAQWLATLDHWSDQGWLRRLDSAMARFVAGQDPAASPVLLMATALLTHLEGRGHACLPLASLVRQPQALLAWPAAAQSAWQTVWPGLPAALSDWVQALLASPLVRDARAGLTAGHTPPAFTGDRPAPASLAEAQPDRGQPLVLGGTATTPLLYLRRYAGYETEVAQAIHAATQTPLAVDEAQARHWLARLFDSPAASGTSAGMQTTRPPTTSAPAAGVTPGHTPASSATQVDWQQVACALALRGRLTVITGGPGTGKTYTAARLLALLLAMHPSPDTLKVALAAPTGKAAARLRQAIDQSLQDLQARLGDALDLAAFTQRMGQAKTVHALLGARPDTRQFKHHRTHPLDLDVLIVDETSMVNLELMAALLQALPPTARLVVLGDKDQLASVEAGAVLGDLCAQAEQPRYRPDTLAYLQRTCGQHLPAARPGSLHAAGDADAAAGARGADTAGHHLPPGADPLPALAQQTVMLRHSRRFGSAIGQLAQAVNAGDARAAQALLAARTATPGAADAGIIWRAAPDQASPATVLALAVQGREQAPASYADYLTLVQQGPSAFAAPARAGSPGGEVGSSAGVPVSADGAAPLPPSTGQLALDFGAPDADCTPPPGSQSSSPVGAAVSAQGHRDDPHTAWVKAVLRAFDRFRILCAVHDGPWGDRALNQGVQRALAQAGLLQPAGEWFVGRPVMVTRNDAALGVFNGDVGVVLPSARSGAGRADGAGGAASAGGSGGALRAWFLDGDALRSVSVSRLAHVDTAFAMTVHKSQGSEFAHTVLVMAPGAGGVMTRELVYTGITRARTHFSLVEGEPGLLATAIRQRVVRASGLQARLGLSIQRGFDASLESRDKP